jgi:hypothetical protein
VVLITNELIIDNNISASAEGYCSGTSASEHEIIVKAIKGSGVRMFGKHCSVMNKHYIHCNCSLSCSTWREVKTTYRASELSDLELPPPPSQIYIWKVLQCRISYDTYIYIYIYIYIYGFSQSLHQNVLGYLY